MMKTYDQVHAGLFWARGRASDHQCKCGQTARHWAYLHNAGPAELVSEDGSPYSEDFSHYDPMCLSCHRKFDLEHNPGQVAAFREVGKMSPTDRERHRQTSILGGKAGGPKVSSMRRRCSECPMESHPSGIANHQRASGHVGFFGL